MNDLVAAAEDYLARGLRVIALTGKAPNGKVHPHGLKDAFTPPISSDPFAPTWPAELERAFRHPATTGVGILTGLPGYYVVDIDGEEGAQAWRDIVGERDFIPERWVAKTGRGLHLYYGGFLMSGTVKLADKLDFKGAGGYVAAPPSRHPDGHYYEWLLPPTDEPPFVMPEALEAVLMRRQAEQEAHEVEKRTIRLRQPSSFFDGKLYAVATFDGIIQRMKDEPEGNRNAVLYWAARTMLEEGADDEDLESLLEAAVENGLTRREALRTISSAVGA